MHPAHDHPVGQEVSTTPASRPARTVIHGRVVRVEAFDPSKHGDSLWKEVSGSENDWLWPYLFDGPFAHRDDFDANLLMKGLSDDPLFYAVVDQASGDAVGYAALMRTEPMHRVIEVGSILYSPRLQKTIGATEAMYLLARYVFEDLGYRRYEWKCNALNTPSRLAALRYGFQFEGIFRQHMIVKSRSRDTAWFAMLDTEWPAHKGSFERWLDPSNFTADGHQIQSLSAI